MGDEELSEHRAELGIVLGEEGAEAAEPDSVVDRRDGMSDEPPQSCLRVGIQAEWFGRDQS
jgi:hypothetical protein